MDDKYYFRVRTDIGKILLTSREFVHADRCMNEIYAIQQYSDVKIVQHHNENNGNQYTLIDASGRMVGESPFYTYLPEMKNDMELMRAFVRKAQVIDNATLIRFFRPVRIK